MNRIIQLGRTDAVGRWGSDGSHLRTCSDTGDVRCRRDGHGFFRSALRPGETTGGHKVVENLVSVHDFHATILHLLGLHHLKLLFERSGLKERLTGVEHPHVVTEILS